MERRRSVSWTAIAFLGGLFFFLFACAHRVPPGSGARGFASTLVIAAGVWFLFAGAFALVLWWLARRSRIRFVTAFAWIYLGLGVTDASVWILAKVLRSDVLQSIARGLGGPIPAQTDDARTIERLRFSFDHPSNWTLDESDPEDHVTLDTPNEGMFQLFPFDDREGSENAFEGIVQNMRGKIGGCRESKFERWGSYEGRGKDLRGRLFWILPGEIRVFQGTAGESGFVAMELWFDEDAKAEAPGFALIRKTFVFEGE